MRQALPHELNLWVWYRTLGPWAFGWTRGRYVFIAGHRRILGRLWRHSASAPQSLAR